MRGSSVSYWFENQIKAVISTTESWVKIEFMHPQSLQQPRAVEQRGKGEGGVELQPPKNGIWSFCQVWDPFKKSRKKTQDNHLEFKIGFIQEEAVEDGGELIHCPQENPEETKNQQIKGIL